MASLAQQPDREADIPDPMLGKAEELPEDKAQKEIKKDLVVQILKQEEKMKNIWQELNIILERNKEAKGKEEGKEKGDFKRANELKAKLKRKEEGMDKLMKELEKKGGRRKRKKKTKRRKKKKTKRRRRRKNKTKRKKRKRKTKRRRKKGGLPYVKVKGQIWPSNAPVRIRVLGGDNDTVPAWINHL